MGHTHARTLSVPIGHAPVARDSPGLNRVVQSRYAEGWIERLVPELGDLCARRLDRTEFVRAAQLELGFTSVPVPLIREPRVRHALCGSLDLGVVPVRAAVSGHFHFRDGAAA